MPYLIGLVFIVATLVLASVAGRSWIVRRRALIRLYAVDDPRAATGFRSSARDTGLARWLARAGYRRPNAQTLFISATAASVAAGLVVSQIYRLIFFRPLLVAISNVPGSAGDMLALVLLGGPWILFAVTALAPALVVRTARRSRVRAIEQDLPLALELFATMAEAGLGFDAALDKIVRAQGSDRALVSEFVNFQHDMLAGMSRSQALRQLARRVDMASLTSFASALIQAEQIGASMAETLQYQAVDLRQRRRENALLRAQALPVKLVFPLVVCFLPGIFVSTLAPVLFQMVEVANGVLRSQGR
ncbi:MAG: type II secretion system F family protein [Acidobacteria bacterium]|nr:type II secretion system F family protein [Acidobacteriota bacterium]